MLKKALEFRTMLSDRMAWILEAAAIQSREMPFCRAAKVSSDMATFHLDELQIELRNAFAEIEQWALDVGAEQNNIVYENEFTMSLDDLRSSVEEATETRGETITVVELADVLDISQHSVRRRCARGEFGMPYLPLGRLQRGKVIDIASLPAEVISSND